MSGGSRRGPPKHQNQFVWKPNAGKKINETEVGGKFRPLSDITGVCPRCKEQIEWKRRYGKYKPLAEPAKWDSSELEEEQKVLDEAIKNARERDRRSLLRAMNKGKSNSTSDKERHMIPSVNKVGELYPSMTLEEYSRSCKDRNFEYDPHDDFHNVGKAGDDEDGFDDNDDVDEEDSDGKTEDEQEEHSSKRDQWVSPSL